MKYFVCWQDRTMTETPVLRSEIIETEAPIWTEDDLQRLRQQLAPTHPIGRVTIMNLVPLPQETP